MPTPSKTLIELENKFWQAIVDEDADTAVELLNEPSVMVSAHGAFKFDHDAYRKMADNGQRKLAGFELTDMEVVFPNVKQRMSEKGKKAGNIEEMNDSSTWIRSGNDWKCVMHTETPAQAKPASH
jgi:hypothetical protein